MWQTTALEKNFFYLHQTWHASFSTHLVGESGCIYSPSVDKIFVYLQNMASGGPLRRKQGPIKKGQEESVTEVHAILHEDVTDVDAYLIRSQTYKQKLTQRIQAFLDIEKQLEDIAKVNDEEACASFTLEMSLILPCL